MCTKNHHEKLRPSPVLPCTIFSEHNVNIFPARTHASCRIAPVVKSPPRSRSTDTLTPFPCSLTILSTQTYLNCGELEEDAIEAKAESPGSCGKEALWCSVELCVEVEEGLEIGSKVGSECLPSSFECAVLKEGRSRACEERCGR
jgi:hypothetical protein